MSLYKISASGLANTGADANGTLWAGFGLLVAGVAVVAVRRRLTT
jgi:LPXTG-motif cell wall-anchored protein